MKPPPNALSSLPLLEAGGYDIGDVESRESDPGVMTPRVQDHPALPRRPPGSPLGRAVGSPLGRTTSGPAVRRPTRTPQPFAPALAPRRHGGSGGMIGLLVLLVTVGAAAGWYFFLRQPAVATAPTQQTDSVLKDSLSVALKDSLSVALKDSLSVVAVAESVAATDRESFRAPAPVNSTWLGFDRIAGSVAATARVYGDRMRQFGGSQIDCTGLSRGLVAVEDVWMEYNVGKKQAPPLDAPRAARDQTLYATVDSVERHFDRSGCPRP